MAEKRDDVDALSVEGSPSPPVGPVEPMAVGARPAPVSLMQLAVPAGWLIAPVVVLRLRRATASLVGRGDVALFPLGLTVTAPRRRQPVAVDAGPRRRLADAAAGSEGWLRSPVTASAVAVTTSTAKPASERATPARPALVASKGGRPEPLPSGRSALP